MEPRRIAVFFYGLFMDVDLLRSKGAQPVHVRAACVPGFALRIGKRATLIPNAESSAYGILMELSHAEIEQLYSEASVSVYRPEAVLAQLADGSYTSALCFNLVTPPSPEEANADYAKKLRDFARRLSLPHGYVKRHRLVSFLCNRASTRFLHQVVPCSIVPDGAELAIAIRDS